MGQTNVMSILPIVVIGQKNNSTGGLVFPFSICDVKFSKPCKLNINLGTDFWDIITERIIKAEIGSSIQNLPPCSSGNYGTDAEITKAKCWILENDILQQMFIFTPCTGETAKCITTYKICLIEGALSITKLTTNIEGTSNCSYEGSLFLDSETFPFDECFDTCY